MAPAVRDRVFDPFFTTKDIGRGTGLGLSVSLGIVAALGGRIEVESDPGRGSTFSVYLRAAPPTVEPASAPRPAPPVASSSGRVLVVDDEPLVGRTLARMLAPRTVDVVTSSHEALEACQRTSYAAIVCDLMMPEINGMELYARLRAQAPALAERVVFVTGGAFTADAEAFIATVTRPVLYKPVESARLRAEVDQIAQRV